MNNEITVGVGTYQVVTAPTKLICIGLGSCAAIALHETRQSFGGLAHAMLPVYREGRDKANAAKYVDTSIYLMIDDLISEGGKRRFITAKLVGGSQMFSFMGHETLDVGSRNIEAARDTLEKEGIELIAEDIGGNCGRTIAFDTESGRITVQSSGRITKEI